MSLLQYRTRLSLICAVIFADLIIWNFVLWNNHDGKLTVAILNIGQGDAIFIQAPNGNQVIVDGGPDGSILRELAKVMPFYDRSIDMIVVTNPDKDHFAGFLDLLSSYHVGQVLEPGTLSDTPIYQELEKKITENNIPKVLARKGMKVVLDDIPGEETSLLVYFPDRDVANWTSNDASIVMKLVYGNTAMMLQGDATQKTEHYLISEYGKDGLHADVLKVGHHGSRTSTSQEYVEAVSPYFAAISLGKNNKYGHPHKETVDTLEAAHVKILRTDLLGTIVMQSNGQTFSVK